MSTGTMRLPRTDRPWCAKEAAEFLGISIRYTYELARTGALPATKRGRRWYFSPAELYRWVGMAQ